MEEFKDSIVKSLKSNKNESGKDEKKINKTNTPLLSNENKNNDMLMKGRNKFLRFSRRSYDRKSADR